MLLLSYDANFLIRDGSAEARFLASADLFYVKRSDLPKQTPFLLLLRYSLGLFVLHLLPVYRSRHHSCFYFGIPWACLSCNCSRFTEVAAILAPTRYSLGLFVLHLLPVYRSSRHSCSHFGIPLLDLIAPTLPTPAPRQHGRIFQRETFAARPRNEKYCDLCDQVYAQRHAGT